MTIYSTPPEDLLKEAQREIAALRSRIRQLEAQVAALQAEPVARANPQGRYWQWVRAGASKTNKEEEGQ